MRDGERAGARERAARGSERALLREVRLKRREVVEALGERLDPPVLRRIGLGRSGDLGPEEGEKKGRDEEDREFDDEADHGWCSSCQKS